MYIGEKGVHTEADTPGMGDAWHTLVPAGNALQLPTAEAGALM